MKLADYLAEDRIVLLGNSTKAEALNRLAAVLAQDVEGVSERELLEAIIKREKLMSTGMGNGLAIPHVRMPGLKRASMAVGVCRRGISDYKSLDAEPVRIVVLIAAPQGQHETYLRLLAQAAEVLKQEDLRRAVIASDDPAEVYAILTEGRA